MTNKTNCTTRLARILKAVKDNGVAVSRSPQYKEDFDYIHTILRTTPVQSILVACILESSFSHSGTSAKQICNMLGCTNIEFLDYSHELDELIRRRLVRQVTSITPYSESNGYTVVDGVIDAIKKDEVFVEEPIDNLSAERFFNYLGNLLIEHDRDRMKAETLKNRLKELVDSNPQLAFCKALDKYEVNPENKLDYIIFMVLCSNYVNQGNDSIHMDQLLGYMGVMADLHATYSAIKNQRMPTQQKGLIEFGINEGMVDTNILALSDEAKDVFFTDLDIELDNRKQCPDLISHESIAAREMYYNGEVLSQVSRLSDILEDVHFKEIQSRLEAVSMRKGFNCIFYGAPGTGKTETVYQLAKQSGRDILQIDISRLKSKWVGESEKTVRSVFKYYQWLIKHSLKTPILLFNEADGIFGIRAKQAERSVDKMNNTIQNIILQEMEKMEGILIATTNLTENLDPAFERRFLYKVEFTVPEPSVRARIWESMMPFLSAGDSKSLAAQYSLSGGQIENISRKCAVEYILEGQNPTIKAIHKMCENETLFHAAKRNRIGF